MDTFIIQSKLIVLFFFILIACSPKVKTVEYDSLPTSSNKAEDTLINKELIHKVQVFRFFSSTLEKDVFTIELNGVEIIKGDILFSIKNNEGVEIYRDEFKSTELFNYNLSANSTREQENSFIIQRMEDFLKEGNFVIPAISIRDKYDPQYNGSIDSLTWSRIKSDKNSIGFQYLIGEENKSWITFDRIQKKVIKYQVCC